MSLPLMMGGSVTPPPSYTDWPAAATPLTASLRPGGTARSLQVLTPGADIGTALTAADAAVPALPYGDVGPYWRADVLLPPGTYPGLAGVKAWQNIGSANPSTMATINGVGSAGGTLHVWGPTYMERLHLTVTPGSDGKTPKYPVHITNARGPVIFDGCTFDVSAYNPAIHTENAGWAGLDGAPGDVIIFRGCTFLANAAGGGGTNLHGSTPGREPIRVYFIDCTVPAGLSIGFSGPGASDGRHDELHIYGGNVTSVATGDVTDLYTDRASGGLTVTGAPAATHWGQTLPAGTFSGGLNAYWQGYCQPSEIASGVTVKRRPVVTDTAPMTLTPNRVYIMKLPASPAHVAQGFGVTVTGNATGTCTPWGEPADTAYEWDLPPKSAALDMWTADAAGQLTTVAMGDVYRAHWYARARYPGQNGWWVKIKASAAIQVEGSAALPGMTECYWSDDAGTTVTTVTTGTPFPILWARGAL